MTLQELKVQTMEIDIVPELLENIKKDFSKKVSQSSKLKNIAKLISKGNATYSDANEYAIELGELLAKSFNRFITVESLPDGKMYYNIAERILNSTLSNNHKLVSIATSEIQEKLNVKSGLKIKGIKPALSQDRIDGIINRVSNEIDFEEVQWILGEPIVNFTQNVVDDAIKINAEFHSKSGLSPTITRTVDRADACAWCKEVSGVFKYPDVPDDVYRRHDRCRCKVEYDPGDSKRQNIWTKEWR